MYDYDFNFNNRNDFGGSNKTTGKGFGIPFTGETGKFNAITDVPGVEVGYSTIIKGQGKWKPGEGPVRTGVTIVLPRGKTNKYYSAGYFVFNGDGETTGLAYLHDYGVNRSAIGITNTNSVGVVRDAIGEWNFNNYGSKTTLLILLSDFLSSVKRGTATSMTSMVIMLKRNMFLRQ